MSMGYYRTIGGFWIATWNGRTISLPHGPSLRFRTRRAALSFGRRYREAAKFTSRIRL